MNKQLSNMTKLNFDQIKQISVDRTEKEEINELQNYLRLNKLQLNKSNDINDITLNAADMSRAIIENCDICRVDNYLYAYDPNSKLMIELTNKIETLISLIITKYNEHSTFKVNNVNKLKSDIMLLIIPRTNDFRQAKIAPNHLILTRDNKCLDFKKKSISDDSEILAQYDFFYKSPCKIITLDNFTTSQEKSKYVFLKTVQNQVLSDWSNDNDEELNFIKEMSFASICGFNREKMIFLMGSGGNGKSSFLEMNINLVGQKHVVNINLQQFNDDNALNKISQSTRFLNGDDLSKKGLSNYNLVSNFKSIISGNTLSVNKKYQDNVDIRTSALLIQATNHEPDFSEFSDAIRSRAIFHQWGAKSFRGKNVVLESSGESFVLKDLINDQLFIDIYFTDIFKNVKRFNQFNVPSSSENLMDDILKDADVYSQFIEDLTYKTNGFNEIPINVAFEYMKHWSKINAPHLFNLKIGSFKKELKHRESQFLSVTNNRLRYNSEKYKHLKALCKILDVDENSLSTLQYAIIIHDSDYISQEDIDSFDKLPSDDLSDKDIAIIRLKAYQHEDPSVMSQFSNYL